MVVLRNGLMRGKPFTELLTKQVFDWQFFLKDLNARTCTSLHTRSKKCGISRPCLWLRSHPHWFKGSVPMRPQLKNWPLVGFSGGGSNLFGEKLHEYPLISLFFLPLLLASFLADHFLIASARAVSAEFN